MPAHDGNTQGGIMLSGHTDVVPVDGQQWDTDPFQAIIKNDRLYGRGACDMKGFVAVVLAMLPQFQKRKLQQPLHFAFSYDEEVGCTGARSLIDEIQKSGLQPTACIVGEPTDMLPVISHKGISAYRCRVHGRATHSSLTPQGCNAIDYASELICYIRNCADQLRLQGPQDTYFDVPFTSISTNMISGGNAMNTVPSYCEFLYEIRNLPIVNPKEIHENIQSYINQTLLPKMKSEYEDSSVEIETLATAPGLDTPEQADVTQWLQSLTGDNTVRKVAYATEAGLFQQASIPTIVCGPGNIEQAHRANEFVTLEQLERCENFLNDLVAKEG
jgi:acetylornithine deacetylase